MSRKSESNSNVWKVLGGLVVGALVGIGAGIIGSEVANGDREKDLLDLRKRSRVTVKSQKKEQKQPQEGEPKQQIYTQIDSFHCPITQEIMEDPMILANCSHSFERVVIIEWVEKRGDCPLCKTTASLKDIKPNYSLRHAIQEIRTKTGDS